MCVSFAERNISKKRARIKFADCAALAADSVPIAINLVKTEARVKRSGGRVVFNHLQIGSAGPLISGPGQQPVHHARADSGITRLRVGKDIKQTDQLSFHHSKAARHGAALLLQDAKAAVAGDAF